MHIYGIALGEIMVLGGLAIVTATLILIAGSILIVDHSRREASQADNPRKDGG